MPAPPVDPIHGKPMTKGMRIALYLIFATLSIGGMTFVTCQWRQKKKENKERLEKIDRSDKALNVVDPAKPPTEPSFATPQAAPATPSGVRD